MRKMRFVIAATILAVAIALSFTVWAEDPGEGGTCTTTYGNQIPGDNKTSRCGGGYTTYWYKVDADVFFTSYNAAGQQTGVESFHHVKESSAMPCEYGQPAYRLVPGSTQYKKTSKLQIGYCIVGSCTPPTGWIQVGIDDYKEGCITYSPIIVSLVPSEETLQLTSAADGVLFRMDPEAPALRVGWTQAGAEAGWLVLDRNGDGKVNDGGELFGNFTPQPLAVTEAPNGYAALRTFDRFGEGGNNDGLITAADTVFANLKIWVDTNHDGDSTGELRSLPEAGIAVFDLDYHKTGRRDANGNLFWLQSAVGMANGSIRQSYDVVVVKTCVE